MKFLSLLMVTILLLQELPFAVSHVEKDNSQDAQRKKAISQVFMQDTKSEGIKSTVITESDDNTTLSYRILSDEEAKALVSNKGILKHPAVSLVTVSGNLLQALKTKESVSFSLPEQRKKIPNQQDLCQEDKVYNYFRLKPHGNLAYRVQGAKCSGTKNSKIPQQCSIGKFSFGKCVDKKSTVVITVSNVKGVSFDKTIEFKSSCKCQKYNNFNF